MHFWLNIDIKLFMRTKFPQNKLFVMLIKIAKDRVEKSRFDVFVNLRAHGPTLNISIGN